MFVRVYIHIFRKKRKFYALRIPIATISPQAARSVLSGRSTRRQLSFAPSRQIMVASTTAPPTDQVSFYSIGIISSIVAGTTAPSGNIYVPLVLAQSIVYCGRYNFTQADCQYSLRADVNKVVVFGGGVTNHEVGDVPPKTATFLHSPLMVLVFT